MSNIAIRADNLGKCYRIGTAAKRHDTLRDAIAHAAVAPLRNLARLRGLAAPERGAARRGDIVWALRDVSFEVARGGVLGIIGRNGAGKSTLLKILSQITKPTTGRAVVNGRVGALLEVGIGFHPDLTGRENVYLNGSILGMDRRYLRRRFDEIVEFSGVERFIDTPVKRYSSGMYLRLAFAVAAHLEPEVLVVDEVLAVGDAEFQKKCIGKMGEVAGEGRTVLFVSHNMAAIQGLCTECVRLAGGAIVARGDPVEVVAGYLAESRHVDGAASSDLASFERPPGLEPVFSQGFLNDRPLAAGHDVWPRRDLEFKLRLQIPHPVTRGTIGIHFENPMGEVVFSSNSRWALKALPFAGGSHDVSCVIRDFPLVPGSYFVTLGFSGDGQQVDWLERIARVEVMPHDTYGTAELPWRGQGYFLADARWEIHRREPESA